MVVSRLRRRLRPRFTLAALLLLVTVISPPLAYIAQRRNWNQHRKALLKSLEDRDIVYSTNDDPTLKPPPTYLQRWWLWTLNEENVGDLGEVIYLPPPFPTNPPFTDNDLRQLRYFPELESLHIGGAKEVTDEGLSVVASLPNLKMLQVGFVPKVSGEFLRPLARRNQLVNLTLHNLPELAGENLNDLSRYDKLETLHLDKCVKLTDESLRAVNLPPQLLHLDLTLKSVGDETLRRWLAQCELETLRLNINVTAKIAPALAKQTKLVDFAIENAPLVDSDLTFLRQNSNLEWLTLSGIPINGEVFGYLPHPKKLQRANFSHTPLTDESAAALAKYTGLDSLNLNCTPLSGEFFAKLDPQVRFQDIYLCGTQFSESGKQSLIDRSGVARLYLPANWTLADFNKIPANRQNWGNDVADAELHAQLNNSAGLYSPATFVRPIDRAPREAMLPVIRLHELAMEQSQKNLRFHEARARLEKERGDAAGP